MKKFACFLILAFTFIACDVTNNGNIQPILDQAIVELLEDDVGATLEVALLSCGYISID